MLVYGGRPGGIDILHSTRLLDEYPARMQPHAPYQSSAIQRWRTDITGGSGEPIPHECAGMPHFATTSRRSNQSRCDAQKPGSRHPNLRTSVQSPEPEGRANRRKPLGESLRLEVDSPDISSRESDSGKATILVQLVF